MPPDGFAKAFCSRCVSALWSHEPAASRAASVWAFDDDPGVRPSSREYVAYAVQWEPIPDDGLECFDDAVESTPEDAAPRA